MIKGSLLSNISLLVPASVVPALMAVLNALGVGAGGALGLAGAFGVAGAGVVAFGAMGISALKCYLTVHYKQLEKQNVIKHH